MGTILFLTSTIVLTFAGMHFLPLLVSSSEDLFVSVWYEYDVGTRFDNSYLTYVTDYALAALTWGLAMVVRSRDASCALRNRCMGVLLCCCVSVVFGGLCHHFFLTINDLNTTLFRAMWTVCVGFVTITGAFIGSLGSHLSLLVERKKQTLTRFRVIVISDVFWIAWGLVFTCWVIVGGFSMKRPACDIFIAGITQTWPSTYVFLALISNTWVPDCTKISGNSSSLRKQQYIENSRPITVGQLCMMFGFYLNAPLLFLYPFLASRELELELGVINCLLHFWLAISWSLQGIGMILFCQAYSLNKIYIAGDIRM